MNASGTQLLQRLLLAGNGATRRLGAAVALFLGTLFLLLAAAMWWNFRAALRGSNGADALGSGYFTVSRTITDADMGASGKVRFSEADITALQSAPSVEEVGKLTQAAFPVSASLGGTLGFSTMLFLEAVPDRMLDSVPEHWAWTAGQTDVPIILAKEFLRTYNYVFAPTQGLPQLSENAVKAIGFNLTLGSGATALPMRGQIVGFSDRITSVLVPQTFLDAMHQQFAIPPPAPARVLVRAKDPADPALVQWLKAHQYEVGGENQRLSTLRTVVNGISIGMGVLALVLLFSGLTLFILIIQLLLARATESLRLLREIGYSPSGLAGFVTRKFLPGALLVLVLALVAAIGLNAAASGMLTATGVYWPSWIGWPVIAVWGVVVAIVWVQIQNSIQKAVRG